MAFVASTSSQSSSTLLKPLTSHSPIPAQSFFSSKPLSAFSASISSSKTSLRRRLSHPINCSLKKNPISISSLVSAAGVAVALVASTASGSSLAAELPSFGSSLQFSEPQNALSLPTWAIHVSSVAEWITAMVLVWQYGERPGCESWKGLSWGMVPLLGGAFCACTWHFFYNSESLNDEIGMEIFHIVLPAAMALAADPISFLIDTTFIGHVLVALQAALTVIGNFTMCIAAYRIFKSTQGGSENL